MLVAIEWVWETFVRGNSWQLRAFLAPGMSLSLNARVWLPVTSYHFLFTLVT